MDLNNLIQPEDCTEQFTPQEIEGTKIYAILGYLFPFLFFLPSMQMKESQAAKLLSNQVFAIFICYIISFVLYFIPVLGILSGLADLILFVLCVLGIIDAVNGKVRKLPLIKALPFDVFK